MFSALWRPLNFLSVARYTEMTIFTMIDRPCENFKSSYSRWKSEWDQIWYYWWNTCWTHCFSCKPNRNFCISLCFFLQTLPVALEYHWDSTIHDYFSLCQSIWLSWRRCLRSWETRFMSQVGVRLQVFDVCESAEAHREGKFLKWNFVSRSLCHIQVIMSMWYKILACIDAFEVGKRCFI